MPTADTSLGGPAKEFAKTVGDLLSRLRHPSSEIRRAGLEEFCGVYWKPIYFNLRVVLKKSNEDAKDLAQAFLLWLVQGDALARYASERGSFRAYLKLLLKHFAHDQDEALQTLKRGGGVQVVGLDRDLGELDQADGDPWKLDPERVFDRTWRNELIKRAVDRVRERLRSAGRALQVQVFDEYDGTGSREKPTYAALGQRLGLSVTDVTNYLFAVRGAIRAEIRSELAAMTNGPEELEEEWNAFFKL